MAKDVVKHYRLTTDDAAAFRKKAEEGGNDRIRLFPLADHTAAQ